MLILACCAVCIASVHARLLGAVLVAVTDVECCSRRIEKGYITGLTTCSQVTLRFGFRSFTSTSTTSR